MSHAELRIETSFEAFDQDEWNRLTRGDFIFADHRFLRALEQSGSIGTRTGWLPRILTLRDRDRDRDRGSLIGALLLFERSNSYGEYIFDWSWANAYQSTGLAYYPKLTAAVPFTPATGPKFLLHPNAPSETQSRLLRAAREHLNQENFSSLHFLFTPESESRALAENGLLIRHSFQYHWRNRGYASFDDFLSALRRKRRYEIRREREAAARLPVRIERFTGATLQPEHAQAMYGFYRSTIHKMGGIPYLTRSFFEQIFATLKDHILYVQASDASGASETPVAGALNFHSGHTLFGRYWGSSEEMRHLHFEVCYYQAIEWAIENGIELFEAGAQGEHKFSRGFLPTLCLSAHDIRDSRFRLAIEAFIEDEKEQIQAYFDAMAEHDPYKHETRTEEKGELR